MESQSAVVVFWSPRGFGFLFSEQLSRRVFFHATQWNRASEPTVNEMCKFKLAPSKFPGQADIAIEVTPLKSETLAAKVQVR
jgi:cold shock CspA family protein